MVVSRGQRSFLAEAKIFIVNICTLWRPIVFTDSRLRWWQCAEAVYCKQMGVKANFLTSDLVHHHRPSSLISNAVVTELRRSKFVVIFLCLLIRPTHCQVPHRKVSEPFGNGYPQAALYSSFAVDDLASKAHVPQVKGFVPFVFQGNVTSKLFVPWNRFW